MKKFPLVWRLSAGAWCVDVIRTPAADAVLRQGKPAMFSMVTEAVSVTMSSRTGGIVTTRLEVVERRIETAIGTLKIDCKGNVL